MLLMQVLSLGPTSPAFPTCEQAVIKCWANPSVYLDRPHLSVLTPAASDK